MKLTSPDGSKVLYWDSDPDSFLKDDVFQILKNLFQENPDTFPLLIIFPLPDGELQVFPVPFETVDEKIHRLGVVSYLMNIFQANWYIIASECWFITRPIEEDVRPSQCEDRKECLLIIKVEKTKSNSSLMFEIIRKENSIKFVETKDLEFGGGRLCELFTMTPTPEVIIEVNEIMKNV